MSDRPVAPWLWRGGVGLLVLVVAVGVTLIIALALGANSPRPLRTPDWKAADLPLTLEAPSDATVQQLLGQSYGDLTLEVEMVPLPGSEMSEYGLIYRAQDTTHYYAFVVGSDGYYAVLRVAGEETVELADWHLFPHVHRGLQANRLRVACSGTVCDFFLNDEYATTIEDTVWLEGDVGLWARGSEGEGVSVQCQSARVWAGE